jgi:phenylalanyl-tRNA synthetase beta chain
MRLPIVWLHDYCKPDLSTPELEHVLTMTGTKVEMVHRHGVDALENFVVGKVLSAERHPDADRLSVCLVDVGDGGDPRQIVCGAPNVAAGQTVAVAGPGAVMPDGTKLGRAKLRGVESNGMILAEDELAIGTDHDGIMVLDAEIAAGTPLADVLPISTEVLELEITPNRPDCLAVYGIAREVHAATNAPLAPPPWQIDPHPEGDEIPGFSVEVRDPELCPRFTLRLFEDVRLGPSPEWMKARLMAAGQRPINNVVDITNYVMLLSGQPMHAFDADLVEGGTLVVRRAREGEKITTLDDVERTLDSDMVVIEDASGPTSIAGIMGGNRSEVNEATVRVLMEAATWNGSNINRTSHKLALRTEASGRFEKQLQPEQGMDAQALASQLMVELCGARPEGGTIDQRSPSAISGPAVVHLREERVSSLLGVEVARDEQAALFERLGFTVAPAGDGLDCTVPYWRRRDVTREADLIEEVARLAALERLPATLPARRGAIGVLTPYQRLRRRAEDALLGTGAFEVVGWSFTDPGMASRLRIPAEDRRGEGLVLANPMSEDLSVMRTTLLGSLLDAMRRNLARGRADARLFERGTVYLPPADPLPLEEDHLGALLTGAARPATWAEPDPPQADFFAAKAVLAAVMEAVRVPWSVEPASEPFLHPGRSARVLVDGAPVGWLGELHPGVAAQWDVEQAAGFELDLGAVLAQADLAPRYRDLTSFPAVRRDVAVVVDDDVPAAELLAAVRRAAGKLLERVEIFDVYRGAQVGEGSKSVALRMEFRAGDRTLTDEEAVAAETAILGELERLGAQRRG